MSAAIRARGVRTVAFQGEPGAFGEDAISSWFGVDAVTPQPQREFADVRRSVLSGTADLGVLPVENSIHGVVTAARRVLEQGGLRIIGDVTCPIRLCLLALPGARSEQLRRVLSHPVALGQCGRFLSAMPLIETVPFYDTAGAAKAVAELGDVASAAVASIGAAARYSLDVIARNIEDHPDNRTRFVIVERTTPGGADVESVRQ